MSNLEQQLRQFIAGTQKNPNPTFSVGDNVYYLVHSMEYDDRTQQPKFWTRRVYAEVVKVLPGNKYEIRLLDPPSSVESNFEGEYLFS